MAQSLEKRIVAALKSATRLADIEKVISDVQEVISSANQSFDAETARSVDPSLSTPEAREARNKAADLEHDIRRLNASLSLLTIRRRAIIGDDADAKRRERYDAAKAERDDLARHIRNRYPELAHEMLKLVQRIAASEATCQAVNADRPRNCGMLESAELLARETTGYWTNERGGSPVLRLSKMHIPLLHRDGGYLPLPDRMTMGFEDRQAMLPALVESDRLFAAKPIPGVDVVPADIADAA